MGERFQLALHVVNLLYMGIFTLSGNMYDIPVAERIFG